MTHCKRSWIIINNHGISLLSQNNDTIGDKDGSESAELWHHSPERRMFLGISTCSNLDGKVSTRTREQKEQAHALQQIEQTLDSNNDFP
jgi:hypothetical protein